MRRIGRLRSEASPSKRAVMAWPPTSPIISREPVPALPKSSVSRGGSSEPRPAPQHAPASLAAPRRPSRQAARQAAPVRKTSSPSSSPSIAVSPTQSRPRISARCETDLSPGGRRRPDRPFERCAVSGFGIELANFTAPRTPVDFHARKCADAHPIWGFMRENARRCKNSPAP